MADKEWLKKAIIGQPWFDKLVQDKAMELLGELLNGDDDGQPTIERKSRQRLSNSIKLKLRWFVVGGSRSSGEYFTEGPRGQDLRVKRGDVRNTPFHWWVYSVDNVVLGKKGTLKEAQEMAEKEVFN